MGGAAPRVSVVIPTRDAGPGLARTLEAIRGQALGEPFDVLVVDSGSTDGTPERCEAAGARVIRIAPEEFGHGRTRNLAIAACGGEYVALTVQDAAPADDHWLGALVDALSARPDAAGAYSRHVPRPDSEPLSRQAVRDWAASLGAGGAQEIADAAAFAALPFGERRRCCTFSNVSSIVRRSVWARWPFPEIPYAEDLAWAYEVMRAGHAIVYAPASVVVHSHDRPTWYEFRRAYVEGKVVGEVLGEDARPLSPRRGVHLARLWPRAGRWAGAVRRAPTPDAMVDRANHLIVLWYRRHFGRRAAALLFADRATWPEEGWRAILDDAEREMVGARAPDGGTPGALRGRLGRLVARGAGSRRGHAAARAARWASAWLHRRLLFDYLWVHGYAQAQRRAIRESVEAGPLGDAGTLEADLLEYVAGLIVGAHRCGELTAEFVDAAYRYGTAVVIGQRLGASRRRREPRGVWRAVEPWLSGGI